MKCQMAANPVLKRFSRQIKKEDALKGSSTIVFIDQEILQRPEQEGAETALRLICATQRILREQMGEESLDEILGVCGSITAVTQEGIERRPIGFAKSGERLLHRFRRLILRSTQDKGPMRRSKRSTAFLQCSRH
jgi:hypothetical protein